MILDSPPRESPAVEEVRSYPSQEQDQDTPMADDAGQEQPASDDWLDDFFSPQGQLFDFEEQEKEKEERRSARALSGDFVGATDRRGSRASCRG